MRIVIHPKARIHGLSDGQIPAAYQIGSNGRRIREMMRGLTHHAGQ